MDEFDLMTELYGTPDVPAQPAEDDDDEIQLNIRSHRSDEAFEKMFAELGGKFSNPRPARRAAPAPSFVKNPPPPEPDPEPEPEPEIAEEVETVPEAPDRPKPAPNKPRRKAQPERKTPEQLEQERRERERRAEQELFEKREREAKEREQQFIEKIANIWNTPEFASGGRVEMSIRTEERKEIRITVPQLPVSEPLNDEPLNYTPLIPPKSEEDKKELIEEAARKNAQDRTEKAASKKISIKKKR